MFVRAYLRASTDEQDANRARQQLDDFAAERGLTIASRYVENESGANLQRPELFRLLNDAQHGDILLLEQVDRLTRLSADDWGKLKGLISARGVKVVSLDLPTSYTAMTTATDDISERILQAVNAMMLDVLAAVARKDYDDRRRRQAQGIVKAKDAGLYRGRPADNERNTAIIGMMQKGISWNDIIKATSCSRSTLSRLGKQIKAA